MYSYPPKRLLVPVDFSEPSLCALSAAKRMARRCGAALDLVNVRELPPAVGPTGDLAGALGSRWDEHRRKLVEKLRAAASDFPSSRLTARCVDGLAPIVLLHGAFKHPRGLIVMGTHGYTGMQRVLAGSVAEAVVRYSNVPVLTVHQRSVPLRIRKILVPMNMTPHSDGALRYALELARDFKARVTALYVADAYPAEGNPTLMLRSHLERLVSPAEARGMRAVVRTEDDVERAIVEEAASGKFDLVVLAAHRKPFFSEYALGNTAMRVLRHSPIPVLSMPSAGPALRKPRKSLWALTAGMRGLGM